LSIHLTIISSLRWRKYFHIQISFSYHRRKLLLEVRRTVVGCWSWLRGSWKVNHIKLLDLGSWQTLIAFSLNLMRSLMLNFIGRELLNLHWKNYQKLAISWRIVKNYKRSWGVKVSSSSEFRSSTSRSV